MAVRRVINRYKMAKHMSLTITDTSLTFARKEDAIIAEAALNGISIIRTSVDAERLDAASCVRHYKSLSQVERAFRHCRPHIVDGMAYGTVCAHIFLRMLAYTVEWHMSEAWRELLFADEDQAARASRDPAERSAGAKAKVARRCHEDGTPIHSFQTLLAELAAIVRNTCTLSGVDDTSPFTITTQPSLFQQRALECVARFPV